MTNTNTMNTNKGNTAYNDMNAKGILFTERAKRKEADFGRTGKAFEIAIKNIIALNAKDENNNKITPNMGAGKVDLITRRKEFSKRTKIEIKTACGELGEITTQEELERFNNGDYTFLLRGADYIIYCPEVLNGYNPEDLAIIAPAQEFLEIISNYDGGKPVKLNSGRGRYMVNIQSFRGVNCRPKASLKLAELYSDTMYDTFPTVSEFFNIPSGATKAEIKSARARRVN